MRKPHSLQNGRPRKTMVCPTNGESGYAMLLVFLMAALIAMLLYKELPRVAFEAQRAKEQLLVERGEQYKRAIQLFVRKVNRYPASLDELESLNNTRFLRKRYLDPMTGKDKWRLIHINGGVLTDSIVPKNKPGQPGGDQQQQMQQNFIGVGPSMAGTQDDGSRQQNNPAMRRRQSDDRPVVTQEVASAPPPAEADDDSDTADNANDPSAASSPDETPAPNNGAMGVPAPNNGNLPGMAPNPAMPGMPPGRFGQPGMYPPSIYNPNAQPGQPGYNPTAGGMPGQPGYTGMSGQSGMTGQGGFNGGGSSIGQNSSSSVGDSGGFPAPSYVGGSSGSPASGTYIPGQTNTPFNGQNSGFGGQPGIPGQTQQPAFGGQPGGFGNQVQPSAFGGGPSGLGSSAQGGFVQNQPNTFNSGPTPGQNPNGLGNLGLDQPSRMQPGLQSVPGMGGTQMGGGIAGVASESKAPSIAVYNERKKYNEWEFVYDQSKDRGLAGVSRNGGSIGTPVGQGNMPQSLNGPGQQNGPSGSPFGSGGSAFNSGGSFSLGGQQQPQPQQPQQPNQD